MNSALYRSDGVSMAFTNALNCMGNTHLTVVHLVVVLYGGAASRLAHSTLQ